MYSAIMESNDYTVQEMTSLKKNTLNIISVVRSVQYFNPQ